MTSETVTGCPVSCASRDGARAVQPSSRVTSSIHSRYSAFMPYAAHTRSWPPGSSSRRIVTKSHPGSPATRLQIASSVSCSGRVSLSVRATSATLTAPRTVSPSAVVEGRRSGSGAACMMAPRLTEPLLRWYPAHCAALAAAADALSFVQRTGAVTWEGRTVLHPCDRVRLRAPLPRPRSLRDFMVVEEHVENSLRAAGQTVPPEWYEMPVYYKGNVDTIYGPDDEIPWPRYTERLDYELEICAVIGRAGREIPADRAHEHILGYTIYNDWSARDIQFREMKVGLGPALGKDFASSIGPALTTADAFDLHGARLTATIDGEQWSAGTLGPMRFTFAQIVEWVSQEQPLHPGDLLGSGTVGRGCGLELDRWLRPGSVVELSADGIGVLRNR